MEAECLETLQQSPVKVKLTHVAFCYHHAPKKVHQSFLGFLGLSLARLLGLRGLSLLRFVCARLSLWATTLSLLCSTFALHTRCRLDVP